MKKEKKQKNKKRSDPLETTWSFTFFYLFRFVLRLRDTLLQVRARHRVTLSLVNRLNWKSHMYVSKKKKKTKQSNNETKTAERKNARKKKTQKMNQKKKQKSANNNPKKKISKKMSCELTAQCFATSVTAIACEYGPPTEGCKCCTQTWTLS